MEDAATPGLIFPGLKFPWKEAAINAPSMIPKFSTLVESASTVCGSACASPCQYDRLATSIPKNCRNLDPQSTKADVTPHGCPLTESVNALSTASTTPAVINAHAPRHIFLKPFVVASGFIC